MEPRAWAALVVGALVLSFAAGIVLLGVNQVLSLPAYPMAGLTVALVGFALFAVGALLIALGVPSSKPPPPPFSPSGRG